MKAGAAVGVHVILATQLMNEDVILFFDQIVLPNNSMFSDTWSGRIQRDIGRRKMIQANDMLRSICGMPLLRVQGANVSMKEVMRVTDFWKSQGSQSLVE